MDVPFPNDPVRQNRRSPKFDLIHCSIDARCRFAASDSKSDGVRFRTKSRNPSSIVRGMAFPQSGQFQRFVKRGAREHYGCCWAVGEITIYPKQNLVRSLSGLCRTPHFPSSWNYVDNKSRKLVSLDLKRCFVPHSIRGRSASSRVK